MGGMVGWPTGGERMKQNSRTMKNGIRGVAAAALVLGVVFVFWPRPEPEEGAGLAAVAEPLAAVSPEGVSGETESPVASTAASAVVPDAPEGVDPVEAAVRAMLAGKVPDDWEPLLLEMVEHGDERTVAALAKAMETERGIHQLMLISRALCGIGTEESLRIFMDFLNQPKNARYREFLAGSLLGLDNEELSEPVLDWMLRTEDYDILMACQEAVGRLALPEAMERIVAEHSQTNYNEYRLELMRTSLASSECPEAIELFADVLQNPSARYGEELQAASAQALARIGSLEAIDVLVAALEQSSRSPTNDFLVEAVASLHESYNQAYLQELFDAATSPNVRYALGQALAESIPMLVEDDVEPLPEEAFDWPDDEGEGEAGDLEIMDAGAGEWESEPMEETGVEAEGAEGEDGDNPFADVPMDEYGYPIMEDEEQDPSDLSGWGPRLKVD